MKARYIAALACAMLATLQTQAARTQFKTDFSGGIPPEMTLYDGDLNTPATAMAAIGFEVGKPWIGYYIEDEDEYVACSTSWYKPAGTSDDWMTLPAISISEGAVLKWRARSSDKKYFDGYTVYLAPAVKENEEAEPEIPLFSIEEESNQWQYYSIDLSEFAGREVYISFVNNSTNKARLYIDDIFAGTPMPLVVTFDTPGIVRDSAEGTDVEICGHVMTELDDPSELGYVSLTCGEETLHIPCTELITGYNFSFSDKLHIDPGTQQTVTVHCVADNGYTLDLSRNIMSASRTVVVEEFTGTWCSWCVRGIVYMEAMKEQLGDRMIPLCVHQDDVMSVNEYIVDWLQQESIPNASVNRKYECDPAMLGQTCDSALEDDIRAAIAEQYVTLNPASGLMDVSTDVVFANDLTDGNHTIAYVLTEDNVHVPGNPLYNQKNAYAGGAAGPMGGFENMPAIIPASEMTYHDVVRYVSQDGPHGMTGELPGAVIGGERYNHYYEIAIPATVRNEQELSLVTMIIDNRTGEIIAAHRLPYNEWSVTTGSATQLPSPAEGPVSVYTLDGLYVGTYPSPAAFRATPAAPGLYLLRTPHGTPHKLLR